MNFFDKNMSYLKLGCCDKILYGFLPGEYDATLQPIKTNIKLSSDEHI
jgi:hypothetical protein